MKYTLTNTINSSLKEVAEVFSDPESIKHWTENLQKVEPISGTFCEVGSQRNLHYLFKKKEMIMKETILEQNLPNQVKFAYDSNMGRNEVELIFEELSENQVRQTSNTVMEMNGLMKVIGGLFKGLFKKQSMKYMNGFKELVEK